MKPDEKLIGFAGSVIPVLHQCMLKKNDNPTILGGGAR